MKLKVLLSVITCSIGLNCFGGIFGDAWENLLCSGSPAYVVGEIGKKSLEDALRANAAKKATEDREKASEQIEQQRAMIAEQARRIAELEAENIKFNNASRRAGATCKELEAAYDVFLADLDEMNNFSEFEGLLKRYDVKIDEIVKRFRLAEKESTEKNSQKGNEDKKNYGTQWKGLAGLGLRR